MQLPRFFSSPLLWRVLALLWFGVLWWLSSQSFLPTPGDFPNSDKLEHTLFFAIGGTCFLLFLRLAGRAQSTVSAIAFTVAFCGLVGAVDEWHQLYTPGRSGGDVWDWTADACGGLVGALVAMGLQKWLARRQLKA